MSTDTILPSEIARPRPGCDGKVRYHSWRHARDGLLGYLKFHRETHPMAPYPCRQCGWWHFGHVSARRITARTRIHRVPLEAPPDVAKPI